MSSNAAYKPSPSLLIEEERKASATERHGQPSLAASSGHTAHLPQVERDDLPAYSPKKFLRAV